MVGVEEKDGNVGRKDGGSGQKADSLINDRHVP